MINYQVAFYENTSDETHCFQAGLKMVLKYFWPEEEYTWEELDKITAKQEGMWTWPNAGILWLYKKSKNTKVIDSFDLLKFSEKGEKYLEEEFGVETAKMQSSHSDINLELESAKKLHDLGIVETRIPEIADIKNFLDDGYLCICNINASHFVVVRGHDETGLWMNNPGLPGEENRYINFADFEKAWAYPNEKARNIIAVKR